MKTKKMMMKKYQKIEMHKYQMMNLFYIKYAMIN